MQKKRNILYLTNTECVIVFIRFYTHIVCVIYDDMDSLSEETGKVVYIVIYSINLY